MLIGATAFLALLIAVLAIPVTLTFDVSWNRFLRSDIRLQWAFGLVRARFPSPQSKSPSPEGKKLDQKTSRDERKPRKKKRNAFAAVLQESFRRRVGRFIGDLWRAIHKTDVSLRMRVGLGDPADTGQLWSICGPVAGMLANVREASIVLEPEFIESTLELDGSGSIRIIPLQMVYLTAALLLSPAIWQGMRQMRAAG